MTYRTWRVLAVPGLAALGLLVWWRWSPDHARSPERETPTATRAEPEVPEQPAPTMTPGQDRPALDRPSLPPQRLDLDRRPWVPKKELRERYEWRAKVFEAFDRFVAETGISDEKAQKLLLIMYDYQENNILLHQQIEPLILRGLVRKQELETWLDDSEVLRTQIRDETRARARSVLTPEEYRAWDRMMIRSNGWLILSDERIVVPADTTIPSGM